MKKKGGTAAGVPRSTGEAQSVTVSNGAPRDQVCGHRISSYSLGGNIIKLPVSESTFRTAKVDFELEKSAASGMQALSGSLRFSRTQFFFALSSAGPEIGAKAALDGVIVSGGHDMGQGSPTTHILVDAVLDPPMPPLPGR